MRFLYALLIVLSMCAISSAAWTVRYVDAAAAGGGDGTTTATSGGTGAWTLAEAANAANTSAGMQINIKAGNYSPGAIAFSDDGSAGSPIWFRGYNTTPGDCDELDSALTLPAIDMSTNQLSCTGAYNWFSGLNITGSTTTSNGVVLVNDADHMLWNCRFTATAASANARALTVSSSGAGTQLVGCYFTSTTTAATIVSVAPNNVIVLGNFFDGGAIGLNLTSSAETVMFNIFDDQSSHACQSAADVHFINNTVYSAGGDGIRVTTATLGGVVANNIFDSCTGNAINSSGGTSASILIVNNAYYNNAAELAGIVESQQVGGSSEADSPLVNPGSNDFSIESDSLAKAGAYPGLFENLSLTGYLDAGAVQRQEASGNTIDPLSETIPGL